MGGIDTTTNAAKKDNTLFIPGQACSKYLAPTPNVTILGCQACLNNKIYLFYNRDTRVWGWNYDAATNTWTDIITVSANNHYQHPCATLNGQVWFYEKVYPEVYDPVSNTWTLFPKPAPLITHGVVILIFTSKLFTKIFLKLCTKFLI